MIPFLLFPHQLFEDMKTLKGHRVYLLETPLFFTQYHFHVQKLILHRASMKYYAAYLQNEGIDVVYVEVESYEETINSLHEATCYDVADFDLYKSLKTKLKSLNVIPSPNFLYSNDDSLLLHQFYINQRKRLGILIEDKKPTGGQWSFDQDNRKKIPSKHRLPQWRAFENDYIKEARQYVKGFHSFGEDTPFYYPTTFDEAQELKSYFFNYHFNSYGDYQDAMRMEDSPLYHSLLSASINIGLINPSTLIKETLDQEVPLNNKEGFIRQIIGWREFIRRTYDTIGVRQRKTNFFEFSLPIPAKVLRAQSGLLPVDDVIRKVHKRGYAHHIERLMILGNYFLLTHRDPDSVYTFFMASFIDAYDWIMVGNVYGMSQYADGGCITTKPYVSGSNYILKMSNYPKGEWCEIWDGLYWHFIFTHQEKLRMSGRMNFALQGLKRMSSQKLDNHLKCAKDYLSWLNS